MQLKQSVPLQKSQVHESFWQSRDNSKLYATRGGKNFTAKFLPQCRDADKALTCQDTQNVEHIRFDFLVRLFAKFLTVLS